MNVIDIVKKYLTDNGYDGLSTLNGFEGYKTKDIITCREKMSELFPAYRNDCFMCGTPLFVTRVQDKECTLYCDYCEYEGGND